MLLAAVPSCDPREKNKSLSIKGEARREGDKGCNFQNRCIYKIDLCAQVEPPLKEYDQDKYCACHRGETI